MRTDAEMAAAFREGDDHAFSLLYERHKRALFAFALRMLGETDAARDVVQDVFLRVFERRRQLNNPESFRSWLFAIGRNHCVSRLRESRKQTPLDDVPEETMAIAGDAGALEAEEDVRMIRLALARLKIEYREVLILREYQDLSYREIAEITESTESAVKSKLFKARRALHEAYKPALAGRR
jgi:RNA polymerase sigma-70 factor, ECF subfamily